MSQRLSRSEKRAGGPKKTTFDSASYIQYTKKANVLEEDNIFKPLLLGEYIKWQMEKPAPFTPTEEQAVAAWHRELSDPSVRKSETWLA